MNLRCDCKNFNWFRIEQELKCKSIINAFMGIKKWLVPKMVWKIFQKSFWAITRIFRRLSWITIDNNFLHLDVLEEIFSLKIKIQNQVFKNFLLKFLRRNTNKPMGQFQQTHAYLKLYFVRQGGKSSCT